MGKPQLPDRLPTSRPITTLELQLLQFVANGLSYKEIAYLRRRSCRTICHELEGVRHKLHAANSTHAVAIALRAGLIK